MDKRSYKIAKVVEMERKIKFFAIADLHDREKVLKEIERFNFSDIDALIMAGDISSRFDFAEEVIDVMKKINKPCFYVPGNNESAEMEKLYRENGFSVHEKVVEFKDYKIAGFGFSPITPFDTPGELTEEEIEKRIFKLDVDNETVLITHCPPKGILDKNFGSSSILKFIKEKKPFLHVFGHIHEIIGMEKHDKTVFINLPPAKDGKVALITIIEKDVSFNVINIL
jgi:Icc-related predicted phosphoesterase